MFTSLAFSQQTKMSHDAATGIIEMVMDHFTEDSEGTFTVQIQDGRAKAQSSLVLIGDGESQHRSRACRSSHLEILYSSVELYSLTSYSFCFIFLFQPSRQRWLRRTTKGGSTFV